MGSSGMAGEQDIDVKNSTQLLTGIFLRPGGSCILTPELPGQYVHILTKNIPDCWGILRKDPLGVFHPTQGHSFP